MIGAASEMTDVVGRAESRLVVPKTLPLMELEPGLVFLTPRYARVSEAAAPIPGLSPEARLGAFVWTLNSTVSEFQDSPALGLPSAYGRRQLPAACST